MMTLIDAISHINWTIERSPKTVAMFSEQLKDLRKALVNAEIRQQLMERENGK